MGHFPSSGPSGLHKPLCLWQSEMSPRAQERSSSETNSNSLPLQMCISSGCVWEKGKMRHVGWAWQLGEGRGSQAGRSCINRDRVGMACPSKDHPSCVWCQPARGWHDPQNDLIHFSSMEKQTNTNNWVKQPSLEVTLWQLRHCPFLLLQEATEQDAASPMSRGSIQGTDSRNLKL